MKAFLFPVAFLAAAVSAQSSKCAADYVVEACLGTGQGVLSTCGNTEYQCKCNAYKQMVQCFDNCPNDERVHTYGGQRDTFCTYATLYSSSTSKPFSAPASTSNAATATTTSDSSASTPSGTGSSTASVTNSAASATGTNSAADLFINTGAVLAAVAGVVAAVL